MQAPGTRPDARVAAIDPREQGLAARPIAARLAAGFFQWVLPVAAVLAGVLLVIGPVLSTLGRGLTGTDAFTGATLANFADLVRDPAIRESARNTVLSGLGVTLFAS